MGQAKDFESLIAEATAHPFVGWDFSWLGKRVINEALPWDYRELVIRRAQQSANLLDLDTGGGEWLSDLPHLPDLTIATESYFPNVSVAARRLHSVGVNVLRIEGAPDNNAQRAPENRGQLPFRTGSLQLVVNRHGSFVATEVSRILALNGFFITQQVGDQDNVDFHRLLKVPPPPPSPRPWGLPLAKAQVKAAGLRITTSGEATGVMLFNDVGALAWYLKAIPWTVPGFSIDAFGKNLHELHYQIQKSGPLKVNQPRFLLEAVKPSSHHRLR